MFNNIFLMADWQTHSLKGLKSNGLMVPEGRGPKHSLVQQNWSVVIANAC